MTKGPLLQAAWDKLPEERRREIQARVVGRIEAYRNLQELRAVAGDWSEESNDYRGQAGSE